MMGLVNETRAQRKKTTHATRRGLTLLGVPFVVSPIWLLVFVGLAWAHLANAKAVVSSTFGAWLLALSLPAVLFVSIVLHEVGHAVVGRRYGMPATEIAVTLLGGHTAFTKPSPSWKAGLLTSAAGPVANLGLGLIGLALMMSTPESWLHVVFYNVALVNIGLAVLNLLPGLPLDGGHILVALAWARTGRRSAGYRTAAICGLLVAAAIGLWGAIQLTSGGNMFGLWSMFIAFSIGSSSWSTLQTVRGQAALAAITAGDIAVPARSALASLSITQATTGHDIRNFVVIDDNNTILGVATADAIASVPAESADFTPLSAVTGQVTGHQPARESLAGDELVDHFRRHNLMQCAVVNNAGQVTGWLTVGQLQDAMSHTLGSSRRSRRQLRD